MCRETKADLDLIGPPTPTQVIGAAAHNIEKSLHKVNIDVAKYFAPVATRLLDEGIGEARSPVQVLAVTMAAMSGYRNLPAEKSVLGQQEGAITLGLSTPGGGQFGQPFELLNALRQIAGNLTNAVGKIELFEDPQEAGFEAAFDITKETAREMIEVITATGALCPPSVNSSMLTKGLPAVLYIPVPV